VDRDARPPDRRNVRFALGDQALVSYTPEGRMHVGLEGTFVHRRGGMKIRTTWTVAERERPSRLRVAVRWMGYEMEGVATLAVSESGTRASFVDTVRPTSIAGRLMVALSSRIMQRDLRERAGLLRSELEAPPGGPGAGDR
jgi:hypothetical protein